MSSTLIQMAWRWNQECWTIDPLGIIQPIHIKIHQLTITQCQEPLLSEIRALTLKWLLWPPRLMVDQYWSKAELNWCTPEDWCLMISTAEACSWMREIPSRQLTICKSSIESMRTLTREPTRSTLKTQCRLTSLSITQRTPRRLLIRLKPYSLCNSWNQLASP